MENFMKSSKLRIRLPLSFSVIFMSFEDDVRASLSISVKEREVVMVTT